MNEADLIPEHDTDAFVSAMRQVASTVNIITTKAPDCQGFRGLTATAFCSVTAAPPTVLVCVNKSSGTHDTILQSKIFCVNVLSTEQMDIALLFSSPASPQERFGKGRWLQLASGAPVLEGCLANIDCTLVESINASTHTIFIGRALAITENPTLSPLIYSNREFSSLS